MKVIDNIFLFFRKLFNKENEIKELPEPIKIEENQNRTNFMESIKVNLTTKKKKEVEVRTCIGDGLGIQNKMTF